MDEARTLSVAFLGQVPYQATFELQQRLRDRILDGESGDALLLLEHAPVVTLGRNARGEGLLSSLEWFEQQGIEVVETDRGGQVTLHAPGQLVGYPILDLKPDRRDVRRYVRDLESVLIATLGEFGISAEHSDEERPIGVWMGRHKVASIGVHLRRWVTTHGFALNLTTDLSLFKTIQPCGLASDTMTSVERITGKSLSVVEVGEVCAQVFCERFERRRTELDIDLHSVHHRDLQGDHPSDPLQVETP